jgi:hypothetical protein
MEDRVGRPHPFSVKQICEKVVSSKMKKFGAFDRVGVQVVTGSKLIEKKAGRGILRASQRFIAQMTPVK